MSDYDDVDEKKLDEMERAGIISPERASIERIRRRWGFVGARSISEATIGNHIVSAERIFAAAGQGALQANAVLQKRHGFTALTVPGPGQPLTPAVTVESSWRDKYAAIADEAGSLRTERDELLRENAQLRRKLERATRTGGDSRG